MAVLFNGSNQYCSGAVTGLPTGSNAFTLCGWMRVSTTTGGSTLASWGAYANGQMVSIDFSGTNIRFIGYNAAFDITGGTSAAANTLFHLGGTQDSGDRILYVNGANDGSKNAAYNVASSNFYVGVDRSGGFYYCTGTIADIRIYNRALDAVEMKIIYESRGTDNITNGLIARYSMRENTDGSAVSAINNLEGHSNLSDTNSPVYDEFEIKSNKL